MVTIDDFAKLDLRVGKVVAVEDHEKAKKPMYRLRIEFGQEIGTRQIIAGIKAGYTKEELLGKKVICIVNLDPKMIAGEESQGMMLAAGEDAATASLLTIDREIAEGSKIH